MYVYMCAIYVGGVAVGCLLKIGKLIYLIHLNADCAQRLRLIWLGFKCSERFVCACVCVSVHVCACLCLHKSQLLVADSFFLRLLSKFIAFNEADDKQQARKL